MKNYTETEMLNLYRNRLGLSRTLMLPAENERQPLDRELLDVLHARYRHLLATAPIEYLPVENLGPACTAQMLSNDRMSITLSDRCIRPVSLQLYTWEEAVYRFHEAGTNYHKRQRLSLLRGTRLNPAVFRSADRLIVYGVGTNLRVITPGYELRAVTEPVDGTFRLSEILLPQMLEP